MGPVLMAENGSPRGTSVRNLRRAVRTKNREKIRKRVE